MSISELKAEIERLSRELDQASSEKIQSAQLGLVLLEEKSALQLRCDELESLYENTKHELDITQEVSWPTYRCLFTSSCLNGYINVQTVTSKLIFSISISVLTNLLSKIGEHLFHEVTGVFLD